MITPSRVQCAFHCKEKLGIHLNTVKRHVEGNAFSQYHKTKRQGSSREHPASMELFEVHPVITYVI